MIRLEDLERKYFFNEDEDLIGKGDCGKVYSLGEGIVGKQVIVGNDDFNFNLLLGEYKNQKLAYNLGMNVPEPYGVFLGKSINSHEIIPLLVMRDLGNKVVAKLNYGVERDKAFKSYNEEIENAKKFVLDFYDMSPLNSIWVSEEHQAYLIDCLCWKFKKEFKQNSFYFREL